GLIDLIADGTLSNRLAKEVFEEMAATGKPAAAVVEEKDLKQITDSGAIEAEVDKAIAAGPDQVAQFKAGNEKVLGWFVGQVMKATVGKANPGTVNEMLRKKLAE
ncbi:MAG: Asp-tRNA(Asn)/Glu-tRNA(Gln) amidotransferase GatCAB subunit B, partial [Alphaproteobacteria bacterium]